MSENQSPSIFRAKWIAFRDTIGAPKALFWLIFAIALAIGSILVGLYGDATHPETVVLQGVMGSLAAIATGFVGAAWQEESERAKREAEQRKEGSVLHTRGLSAVRGLGLLISAIESLRGRVTLLAGQIPDGETNHRILSNGYSEIQTNCDNLKRSCVAAISEWTDIVPEANVAIQVGYIAELNNQITDLVRERDDANARVETLSKQAETGQTEIATLKSAISAKDAAIAQAKQLRDLKEIAFEKNMEALNPQSLDYLSQIASTFPVGIKFYSGSSTPAIGGLAKPKITFSDEYLGSIKLKPESETGK